MITYSMNKIECITANGIIIYFIDFIFHYNIICILYSRFTTVLRSINA